MTKVLLLISALLNIATMTARTDIPAIDVHSHVVTDEYILCAYGCNQPETDNNMCDKSAMQPDGIVRLSKIRVHPEYLEEYMRYAMEVGTTSLETEPGVLTMYAVADKDNPCNITILETYASAEAYRSHIASEHFQKYKQGTIHMVDSLVLDDVTPLNPDNRIINFIDRK
ncbi:MAG: antibiotic biosynthesis monooxygenase [Paramuribaculum sp.]|nr:antibiotic biosynthesis monooxygenase [Paramuribaculum sp.]